MIPAEIVDHILSSLHSDQDYTSLESCSVVFPLLVDRHLYSQITFFISVGTVSLSLSSFHTRDSYVVDPTVFSRTLLDHPHISNCVRDVRIILVATPPLVPQNFQVISAILSALTHIESLTLTTTGNLIGLDRTPQIPWPTLGPEFCTKFQTCLRLPSLKKAAITNFQQFPLDIVNDCKTLTHLSFRAVKIVDGGDIPTSPYPRLSFLRVDYWPISDWTRLISWAEGTLQSLSLYTRHNFDFITFRILIAACSASLVNLELNCKTYFDPYKVTHLDDPPLRLPLLEYFVFRCNIKVEFRYGTDFSCLNLLVPFLETIQSVSSTHPIRLTLYIAFHFYCSSDQPIPDWSNITDILVLPIFRHPIELCITLLESWCTPDMDALLLGSLEQNHLLKELLADGKLVLINKKARLSSKIHITYPDED